MSEVTAVVVAYNSGAALLECLRSLDLASVAEIVLVDNGSSDGSIEGALDVVPRSRLVEPPTNLGFGGGVNAGVASSSGDFVLVCNSDLLVTGEAIDVLVDRMETDERAAVVGPQLVDTSGTPQVSARAFPTIRRSSVQAFAGVLAPGGRSARCYAAENRERARGGGEVDWVTGACFLVRRAAFEEIGGFDSSYFMYVEEVDLCWRLEQAGWRVLHEPRASVVHIGGVSASKRPFSMVVSQHLSLWRFARSSASEGDRWMLPLVAIGLLARLSLVLVREVIRAARREVSDPSGRRSDATSDP